MRLRNLILLSVVILLIGCGGKPAGKPPKPGVITLASGKEVGLMGVGQIRFSQDSPALMIRYQTALKIEDVNVLRKEATEVWQVFVADAEKAKLKSGIVSANEKTNGGIITRSKGYNFIFQRKDDGTWQVKE